MLDLSIGKYIRLQKRPRLSINLTLNNVTNNTDMKTGGYEQNRDDAYDDGRELLTSSHATLNITTHKDSTGSST